MSRSSYTDDYGDDYPGQLGLYRGNVARSIRSKAGQARLRELRDALLALPIKELAQETFVDPASDGGAPQVCALGAWAVQRCAGDMTAAAKLVQPEADDDATFDALKPFGWPRLVVMDAIYENDREEYKSITVEGPQEAPYNAGYPVRYRLDETPAERYARVLAWVEEQIVAPLLAGDGQ